MARPRGTYGEISLALLAAAEAGPATVRQLATRSQVGWRDARRNCSRLAQLGALEVLSEPGRRPMLLALPSRLDAPMAGTDLAAIMGTMVRSGTSASPRLDGGSDGGTEEFRPARPHAA